MLLWCVVAWRAKVLGMTVWALVKEQPASPQHFVDKYVSVAVQVVHGLLQ